MASNDAKILLFLSLASLYDYKIFAAVWRNSRLSNIIDSTIDHYVASKKNAPTRVHAQYREKYRVVTIPWKFRDNKSFQGRTKHQKRSDLFYIDLTIYYVYILTS